MTTTQTQAEFLEEPTRVWSISYLAEMMGEDTSEEMAEAMRDLLIEAGYLDWSDGNGGWTDDDGGLLYPIPDDIWDRLLAEAVTA